MQKKINGRVVFLFFVLGIIAISLSNFIRSPREKYHHINFETDSWTENFSAEHQLAIIHGDDWAWDPKAVALRLAGYPNDDNIAPEKIDVEKLQDDTIVVTVLSKTLMDDSVQRKEIRVELAESPELGAWIIVWSGIRQQCARSSFGLFWSTSPCP